MKTYGHLRREHSIAQAQRVSFAPGADKAGGRDRVPGDGVKPDAMRTSLEDCWHSWARGGGRRCCAVRFKRYPTARQKIFTLKNEEEAPFASPAEQKDEKNRDWY